MTDDLRYPVGKFQFDPHATPAARRASIAQIREAPAAMRAAVRGLSDTQLDTPYRPEGWTVRQVVHHVPDSHLNAYCRFKLALTEDTPLIKPYDEAAWAKLEDTRRTPVDTSLALLESLHQRWVTLLESLKDADYGRGVRHPEAGEKTVDWLLQLYSWHGRHHVAHITSLRQRQGW